MRGTGAGDVDDGGDARVPTGRDEVLGPARIDLVEGVALLGLLHGQAGEGQGDDELVDAFQRLTQDLRVADVGDADLDVVGELSAGAFASGGEDDDSAPAAAQLSGDLAAHEPGAAGDGDDGGRGVVASRGRFEDVVDSSGAEVEDVLELRFDDQAVGQGPERAERHLVFDAIVHADAALDLGEVVLMHPRLVGALLLHIPEAVRRIDGLDAAAPAGGDAEERSDGVVDDRAGFGGGLRRVDLEAHRARRDAPEVLRAREEVPHGIDVGGDLMSAVEDVLGHRAVLGCTWFVQHGY